MIGVLLYLILSPIIGCLLFSMRQLYKACLSGEKIKCFPLSYIQSLADISKAISLIGEKRNIVYSLIYLLLNIIGGCVFYSGGSLHVMVILLAAANISLVLGSSCSKDELISSGAYTLILFQLVIGFYLTIGIITGKGSFLVFDILKLDSSPGFLLPGLLMGYLVILVLFPKKSYIWSRNTTDKTGLDLLFMELGRFYELVQLYGMVFLLHFGGDVLTGIIGIIICLLIDCISVYITKVLSDNSLVPAYPYIAQIILISGFINLIILFP